MMSQDPTVDPIFQKLCDQITEQMESHHVPGVAVGVLRKGQELTAGFGVTNLENPLPVTPETLFQVGSISKTFTATTVMRLVEMGKLDLDTPICTYLPDLQLADEQTAKNATIRHLLTHTGGWVGDYFDDFGQGETALAQIVEKMAGLDQLIPLGKVFSYNNSGFYLAGRVIEMVTGSSFEYAVKELVFDPLGLKMAYYFPEDLLTYRFASGHLVDGEVVKVARPWAVPRASAPAGGVVSNIPTLLQYARFHMGDGTAPDGTRLLSKESISLIQSPQFSAGDRLEIGLSWFISHLNQFDMIDHGGSTNGQMAGLYLIPERSFALAILTNSSRGSILNRSAIRFALKNWLNEELPDPAPLNLTTEELALYAGRYYSRLNLTEIFLEEGRLILKIIPQGGFPTPESPPSPAPPPMQIALYAIDKFVVIDQPMKNVKGEFLRGPGGEIDWIRFGLRVQARQDK
jgi:CubicO group peptidase (beta-lactamase class C family)